MPTRAIRGATVVAENTETAILSAARELLQEIARANALQADQLISIIFTFTRDLDAVYPTRAARELGWTGVALLDAQQPHVQGDLPRCLRVLVHCESARAVSEMKHIYLHAAKRLRPDLSE
ncbi:MAG: chorismate mutase [Chloroflexi bacterium]|nr:chorismate mutase [Chloroflexota bacterium]